MMSACQLLDTLERSAVLLTISVSGWFPAGEEHSDLSHVAKAAGEVPPAAAALCAGREQHLVHGEAQRNSAPRGGIQQLARSRSWMTAPMVGVWGLHRKAR